MLRVRLPSGQVLLYNQAYQIRFNADHSWSLYSAAEPGGKWVATIASSGLVVEAEPPCKIENNRGDALEFVAENIQSLGNGNTFLLRRLKKELQAFNARTGNWATAQL